MQQFREFQIIAATGYAAQQSTVGEADAGPPWDELAETEQRQFTEDAMAVARGETIDLDVFAATVKAILGYNGGQGGLALERIADLGGAVLSLGLRKAEEVSDQRDIVDDAKELLAELAERRRGTLQATRVNALSLATSNGLDLDDAKLFAEFIEGAGHEETATNAIALAIGSFTNPHAIVEGRLTASRIVDQAKDFYPFLAAFEPDEDEPEQDPIEAERETASVQ